MLFESPINLNLKDAEVTYYPNFININEADSHFSLVAFNCTYNVRTAF